VSTTLPASRVVWDSSEVARETMQCATAEAFAKQFTHFEWEYLCSYRWFLKDLARALEIGDFASLCIKARRKLVRGRIRRPGSTTKDELSVCHSTEWYE
jgi:hypothetical protein